MKENARLQDPRGSIFQMDLPCEVRINCGPGKAVEQNILLNDFLPCRFLDPVRVELLLGGLPE